MAVAVTSSKILNFSTVATVTRNNATANTDALAEVFTITPTAACTKMVVIMEILGTTGTTNCAYSFAAGDFWASKAKAGVIPLLTESMIQIESGNSETYLGTILLTLTPNANDKLKDDLLCSVKVIEIF
jgi:hypothetical protein